MNKPSKPKPNDKRQKLENQSDVIEDISNNIISTVRAEMKKMELLRDPKELMKLEDIRKIKLFTETIVAIRRNTRLEIQDVATVTMTDEELKSEIKRLANEGIAIDDE